MRQWGRDDTQHRARVALLTSLIRPSGTFSRREKALNESLTNQLREARVRGCARLVSLKRRRVAKDRRGTCTVL